MMLETLIKECVALGEQSNDLGILGFNSHATLALINRFPNQKRIILITVSLSGLDQKDPLHVMLSTIKKWKQRMQVIENISDQSDRILEKINEKL